MLSTQAHEEKIQLNQLIRDLIQGDSSITPAASATEDSSFDQIPYIVKQVFQAGRENVFSDNLGGFISRKEVEIERMCGLHYQEFVQSVDQLLKVRTGSSTIKERIVTMNEGIQSDGMRLVEKKRELVDHKQKLVNVELTLEATQSCLFVLDICNRISIQIANKKYFSALRMIQELQSSHLKLIKKFSFSKMVVAWLPQVQEAIREAVLRDLKDWFKKVKDGAPKIGKMALNLTVLRQDKANEILNTKTGVAASTKSLNQVQSMEMAMTEEFDPSGIDTDSAELDFTPLFQCIHIHEVLGRRIQLKLEFDESRRLQAELILHSPLLSLASNDLTSIERYIQEIAGFFVIEATVISTTHDFRSKSSVETLWQTCTGKMNAHLFEALTACTSPDLYLSIKLLVTAFISTLEIYGYAVTCLTDLMYSLLDRYAELMKSTSYNAILKVIDEGDDYSPLIARDSDELDDISASYIIPDEVLKKNVSKRDGSIIFPKALPFSAGFPIICGYIHRMISGFYKFADGFSQQNHEIDDLLKKTLESLLLGINSAYNDKISTAGISVVYQIMNNMSYFDSACRQFEDILMERRYSARTMRVSLTSAKVFSESKAAAEQRIYAIINAKSDSFLDIIDYNWASVQPRREASSSLSDLITFLTTVMTSTLADLPPKIKSLVYFEAFDHIATKMKSLLLYHTEELTTLAALETIEYDILYLESSCKKLQDSQGQDSFVEMRQLIAYGRSERYEDILTASVKNKKYGRIEISEVILLLEKMRMLGGSGWFGQALSASDKALKAQVEAALKLLKAR